MNPAVTSARGLDTLAYGSLWLFVLTLPWSDEIPMLGNFVIGRWLGLLTVAFGLMRFYVVRSDRRLSPLHLWMLAFVAWAAFSFLWTIDPAGTISQTGTYVQLLVATWLIWELAAKENRVVGLLEAYLLGAAVGSASTLFNYWNGRSTGQLGGLGGSIWDQDRYSIGGFNANDLGLTLALAIPIAFYLITRKRGFGWVALSWLILAMCMSAILLTGSRGSLLATVAGLAMLPFLLGQMTSVRRFACICLCIALVAGGIWLAPQGTLSRYQNMFDELQGGTLTHRTLIWTAGLDVFRDHALIGTGAGSYGTAVLRAIDRPYVAHNSFLSVLVELGVIGVILFGGLLASMFYSALRMAPRERHFWLAMLITWVVGVSVLTWESRKPTWFLFAMLAAHVHASRTVVVRRSVPYGARPTVAPWEQPLHPRAVDSL